ncbi:MAG: phage portal protein [Pirellulales bacterium]|nr:phage portal protein [Pirellulales bacterium]
MPRSTNVETNWLDNAISTFFPVWGVKRIAARYAGNMLTMSGGYKGAKKRRPHEKWLPGGGSADEDLLVDLPDLRERSRDLNRNNGIASGATDTVVTNVVGSGIKPQSQVNAERLGISRDEALEVQQQMETAWARWKIDTPGHARGPNGLQLQMKLA